MTDSTQTKHPILVGIINVTEDSFSDGGQFLAPGAALARAKQVTGAGAGIVEWGPASSHPDSTPVDAETQIARLTPLLDAWPQPENISIDCTLPAVQRFALERRVGYINDIQGFADKTIYPRLADSDCRLVVMHAISKGELAQRVDIPPDEIMASIQQFFDQRIDALTKAGIDSRRLILDPGMGFFLGTNPETSLRVLRSVKQLQARYDLPIMISVSRKSFLQKIAGVNVDSASAATLAAELFVAELGVEFIRTHDVEALSAALKVWQALNKKKGP